MVTTLASENIEVKFKRTWKSTYHHGWESWMANPFEKMVDETYQDIRSKFLLYSSSTHTTVYPLMKALVLLFDEKQFKFRHKFNTQFKLFTIKSDPILGGPSGFATPATIWKGIDLFVVTHRLNTFLQNLFRVWYRVIRLYKKKTSRMEEERRSGRIKFEQEWHNFEY